MFRKIDKTSTFNDVLKQIIENIQNGELQPGDALPAERILAEEFRNLQTSITRSPEGSFPARDYCQRTWRCQLCFN